MPHVLLFIISLMMLATALPAMAKDSFTVVIDAGHGGKDPGAVGTRTNEKSINIAVARRLKELFASRMKDADVHMTRTGDYFVTLQGRCDFANRKKADIFISIHANALSRKNPAWSRTHGASVYTMGLDRTQTNLAVAMRENEVMKLEDDYRTVYEGFDPSSTESYIIFEMMQSQNLDKSIALAEAVQNQLVRHAGRKNNGVRQAPLWVLVRTAMPAILVELDYISNPTTEKYMMSDAGVNRLAEAIFKGVERYRENNGMRVRPPRKPAEQQPQPEQTAEPQQPAAEPEQSAEADTREGVRYKVQFMTSPRVLASGHRSFKGIRKTEYYREGGMVKYTTGSFATLADAKKELARVKKKFPDAFIIKTRNGKRVKD